MVNVILVLVIALIAIIWLSQEFKEVKNKFFTVFLILLLVFTCLSFSYAIKERDIDLKTTDGLKEAGHIYVLWLGQAFRNIKVVTGNAIGMNWKLDENVSVNESVKKPKK